MFKREVVMQNATNTSRKIANFGKNGVTKWVNSGAILQSGDSVSSSGLNLSILNFVQPSHRAHLKGYEEPIVRLTFIVFHHKCSLVRRYSRSWRIIIASIISWRSLSIRQKMWNVDTWEFEIENMKKLFLRWTDSSLSYMIGFILLCSLWSTVIEIRMDFSIINGKIHTIENWWNCNQCL